jgi:hypothetical protein
MREGVLVSVAVHGLIITVSIAATRPASATDDEPVNESIRYLVPMDRVLGVKPKQERAPQLQWVAAEGKGGGNEAVIPRKIEKRAPVSDEAAGKGTDVAAPPEPPMPAPVIGDTVLTVLEVDSAVTRYEDSAAPAFPPAMLLKNIEGTVAAQFIVDTLGRVDTTSFHVLESTHPDFSLAVRQALPGMRFHPAVAASHKVRQLVQQMFSFKILTPAPPAETAKAKKPE